jgi:hypothetical protein
MLAAIWRRPRVQATGRAVARLGTARGVLPQNVHAVGGVAAAPALQKVLCQADGNRPIAKQPLTSAADLAGSRTLPTRREKGVRVRAPTAPRLPAERAHLPAEARRRANASIAAADLKVAS